MTTCSKGRCSPAEAHAGMRCRPLYFQGLTVLRANTKSSIVRPLRPTPTFPLGKPQGEPNFLQRLGTTLGGTH